MVEFNFRQQQAVAFSQNTVVNASAGTGKTATLVGVYLARLAEGITPGQILAITFTEKAAAEMRDRLKREVLQCVSSDADAGAEGARWRLALTGIANAPISTIHAFCSWLLKENPLEAGIDPHFTIWDEDESGAVRREVILDRVRARICAGHPGVQALFRDLQLLQASQHGPRHLVEAVEAALRWLNGLGVDLLQRDHHGRHWLGERFAAQQAALAQVRAAFAQGCHAALSACSSIAALERVAGKNAQTLVQRIQADFGRIDEDLRQLTPEAPPDAAACFDRFAGYLRPGRLSNDPANDRLRSCLETLQRWLGDAAPDGGLKAGFGALKSETLTRDLIDIVGMVQAEYTRRKTEARSLDFDDLLIGARNLLKCHPAVRRRYKQRFRAILVDEFQDTDELQGEIIGLLAEERVREQEFPPSERYRSLLDQLVLEPRRLFIVGDPKQSIYRFRRADVGVFVSMAEKILGAGGNGVALVENYRSTPEILTFANTLFRRVMDGTGAHAIPQHADTRHRIRYAEQDHLQPGRAFTQRGRLILVLAEEGVKAQVARAVEAKALAALIAEFRATGELTTYRDAAILLKTHAFGQLYEDALRERGIPYYRVKGGGFFQRQETSDLAALLAFLVDPGDDLALAQVLTSPFAGLDFADLYQLCERRDALGTHGRVPPLSALLSPARQASAPEPLRSRLTPFAGVAAVLLRLRDRLGPAELLEMAIRETGYDAVLMAQEEGEQRVANLAKLLELARGFSRKGLAGVHEFTSYLQERIAEDSPRTPDAQILSEEEDVVRIMTIHQAKGLEFDVVLVPDLAHQPRGDRGERVTFDERWGVMCAAAYGVKRAKLPHTLMREAEQIERDKDVEEQKRLLYVALTRARRILVMGEGSTHGRGLWQRWVMTTVKGMDTAEEGIAQVRSGVLPTAVIHLEEVAVELKHAATLARQAMEQAPPDPLPPQMMPDDLAALQRRVWGWTPPRPSLVELSPTSLATLAKCVRYFFLHEVVGLDEDPPGSDGGLPAVDKGRIAHGVLERVPLDLSPEDVPTHVRESIMREPGAYLLTAEELDELTRDLVHYLQSSSWQTLRSNPTLQREVPFSLLIAGEQLDLAIQGRMDAVIMRDGVPVVVDHKYAHFDRHKEAGYQVPMAVYALAAMRALGSPRAEVRLNFLRTRVYPTETQTLDAAHEIERQMLQLAEAYVSRQHDTEVDAWPRIPREQCERARCGFRPFCWR